MLEWLRRLIGPDQGTLAVYEKELDHAQKRYATAQSRHNERVVALSKAIADETRRASEAEEEARSARAYADSLVPDELRERVTLGQVPDFPAVFVKPEAVIKIPSEAAPAAPYQIRGVVVSVEIGAINLDDMRGIPAATRAQVVAEHVDRSFGTDLKKALTRAIAIQLGQ